jgi:Family of unknown function (DUF5954)
VTRPGARPPEALADELRARARYPQVTLLGAWFTVAEQAGGAWQQHWPREAHPPAREWLASHFRDYVPAWEKPGPQACAAYAQAAGKLERGSADEVTAAGRRFRIVRVERLTRMNAEGPEPLRPSDFDPYPLTSPTACGS